MTVLSAAFVRRPKPRDPAGISVDFGCSAEESFKKPKKCYGVVFLYLGHVRETVGPDGMKALDVVPDGQNHGNIIGIPY